MSFNTKETSFWEGNPVELFLFEKGAVKKRYTNADRDITRDSLSYTAIEISRSEIRDDMEAAKNNVKISLPITADIVDWWIPYSPSQRIFVTCMATHYDDVDEEVIIEWSGRVMSVTRTTAGLELLCEPTRSSSRRPGQSCRWCRGCPLAVYGQGIGQCNLDPLDFETVATLDSVSNLSLTSADFDGLPLNLAGGYLTFEAADGELEQRSIISHVDDTIVVNFGHFDFAAALEVKVYPGCPGDWAACEARLNTDNYGGDPSLPVKNPFSGNPVR